MPNRAVAVPFLNGIAELIQRAGKATTIDVDRLVVLDEPAERTVLSAH